MGKIFYLMGKSSTGKDTVFKELKKAFPEIKQVVLYTTRPIREGENDGEEYYFVNENQLSDMQAQGRIIELREYNTVHGIWKYFTADDGQICLDDNSYLMIGTLEAYDKITQYFGRDQVIPIYLELEDGERLSRALEREKGQETPKYAELCRRFLADTEDFSQQNLEQAGVQKRFYNHDLSSCIKEISLCISQNL